MRRSNGCYCRHEESWGQMHWGCRDFGYYEGHLLSAAIMKYLRTTSQCGRTVVDGEMGWRHFGASFGAAVWATPERDKRAAHKGNLPSGSECDRISSLVADSARSTNSCHPLSPRAGARNCGAHKRPRQPIGTEAGPEAAFPRFRCGPLIDLTRIKPRPFSTCLRSAVPAIPSACVATSPSPVSSLPGSVPMARSGMWCSWSAG